MPVLGAVSEPTVSGSKPLGWTETIYISGTLNSTKPTDRYGPWQYVSHVTLNIFWTPTNKWVKAALYDEDSGVYSPTQTYTGGQGYGNFYPPVDGNHHYLHIWYDGDPNNPVSYHGTIYIIHTPGG